METKIQKLLLAFFNKFESKRFIKGKTIVRPTNDKIFFLTKGIVRMFVLSKKGEDLTLNIYKAYSFFPISLIFNTQNKYTFQSLTEVQGHFAPKKDFEKFIVKNPNALLDLLKRIYKGLDGFYMISETLLSKDAFYRVLSQLIIYARRFGQENQNKVTFDWRLTHHQLASQTGLARESVTRQIKKLQNKGLVGYLGKKLFIHNLSKLEEEYFLHNAP